MAEGHHAASLGLQTGVDEATMPTDKTTAKTPESPHDPAAAAQAAVKLKRVVDEIRASDCTKVKVAVTDIDGVLRGKFISREKFLAAVEGGGFGVCNVVFGWDCADACYDNTRYTGWHTGYPDAQACIDLTTYRRIPWEGGVPFFLADFVDADGAGLGVCPRRVLRRVLARAAQMGYEPIVGVEYEWFNFSETPKTLRDKGYARPDPLTPAMFGYSLLRASANRDYFRALIDDTRAFGIPLEGLHTETGPGVYEAAIEASPALEAADRGVLFKTACKQIAQPFGIMPSFMAKWDMSLPGCSGHLHQSLRAVADGSPLFFAADHPHGMSPIFQSYVAGQMQLLPELLALYAPTINSYKRLVEGHWAPTRVTWGVDNRTTALRVIAGSPKSTRLETRVTGSDINAYLAIAAALASGLYGIEQGLRLEVEPVAGNGYRVEGATVLPANLLQATERLAASKMARRWLGDAFVDHFVATRVWEWRQFSQSVTSWEMQRYFEII